MRSPGDHNPARGYEWWLMCEAHKRNPSIVIEILPWGAPGWVGKDTLYTAKMAEYVVDFINTAKNEYSIDIAYTGVWNEKEFNMSYVKELHRQLLANHLTTRIICCDEYPGEGAGQWSIADDILKDPELAEAIQVIGVHYPLVDGKITTTDAARKTGKPLWSSEDQPNSGGGPIVSRDWPIGGRILAHLFNQNYVQGSLTSTDIWSPVTSYYDNLAAPHSGLMYANTPWSGHYDVQSTVWVTAHTTQFAQPGWQYLDNASGYLPGKGSYVTLRSTDQRNWSMIVETIGARSPQSVSFKIKGALAATQVHVWETNSTHIFEHLANLEPVAMILGVLSGDTSHHPGRILSDLNKALIAQGQLGFTTACCIRIALSGEYTLANAGHIPPYIDGREVDTPPALPLGLAPDVQYEAVAGTLAINQRIVLVSDGVIEARNAHGELLGFARVGPLTLQPAQIIADTAKSFGQEDDITVFTLTRLGVEQEPITQFNPSNN